MKRFKYNKLNIVDSMSESYIGIRQIVMFTPSTYNFPIEIISLLESKNGSQIAIGFQNEDNSLLVDLLKVKWEKEKNFSSKKEGEDYFNDLVKIIKQNESLITNKEEVLKFFD